MPSPSGAEENDSDNDNLMLEENEEEMPGFELEDNVEDNLNPSENLLSPPRGWPECFKSTAMKTFIAKELAGTRVRLSEPPEAEHLEMAAGLGLSASDSRGNALKLRDRYGWEVHGGFALLERADAARESAAAYVGQPHYWNSNARGLWLDLTPRRYKDLVLVESASTPVPMATPGEQKRHEAMRAAELKAAAQREADRKAAKAAEKAEKKAQKEARHAARKAQKAAEEAEKQRQIDEMNAQHDDQLTRADPMLRQQKHEEELEKKRAEEQRIVEAREAAMKAAKEKEAREAAIAAEEAAEAAAKAAEEEKKRLAREAAATKAREEKKLADAKKANERAAKEAAEAAAKVSEAGGTHLCWDLHVLLSPLSPHKEAGAKCFGVGDYSGALEAYSRAIDAASDDADLLAWPSIESLIIACRANAALCCLKLGRNAAALAHCDAALALPGGNACGKALVSKLLCRRLTALVEMSEDPLEDTNPADIRYGMRDAYKRGLATGKAPAAKDFRKLAERVDAEMNLGLCGMLDGDDDFGAHDDGYDGEEPARFKPQALLEVVRIVHSAYHPDRTEASVDELRLGIEHLLDTDSISPPSPLAVADPSGASLLYGVAAGLAEFAPRSVEEPHLVDFFTHALDVLLDHDVPVDLRLPDASGAGARTALMYAAACGSLSGVKALLSHGAGVNLKDPRGVTPLMYACGQLATDWPLGEGVPMRRVEAVRALVDAKAHLDVRDIAGQSALMNACSRCCPELVELLLEAGASVSLRHGKGSTAVGVLAAALAHPTDEPTARKLIARCVDAAGSEKAKSLLREEVKASEWFHAVDHWLKPTHNEIIERPGALMAEREAALVRQIFRMLGMDDDYLTRPQPERLGTDGGGKWGNFYEQLQRKLTARIPAAFLTVWTDHPSMDDFALLSAYSTEAISAAEAVAARLAKERYNGIRTSAFHPETLRAESLVPWQARGRVPRCMKEYQNLVVLPLRRCLSHAVPTNQALKALAKAGPLIEMGAGGGYWAAMLMERGVDVLAYDLEPPNPATISESAHNGFAYRPFCPVHRGDAQSIFAADPSLANRTLLLIWPGEFEPTPLDETQDGPPGLNSWEAVCLRAYLAAGGQRVAYVGERESEIKAYVGTKQDAGVSASKAFQVCLREKFVLQEQIDVPRLFYSCDDLTIWKRK